VTVVPPLLRMPQFTYTHDNTDEEFSIETNYTEKAESDAESRAAAYFDVDSASLTQVGSNG